MKSEPLLCVQNLTKYFPIHKGIFRKEVGQIKAVEEISFSLYEGEIVGIVGESGSGKSTAARATIRLIEPTSGTVTFLGKNIHDWPLKQLRQQIQMVFQDPFASLNPRKTIRANLGDALLYHKLLTPIQVQARLAEVLSLTHLPQDSLGRYPHEFSGGQQQRLCIARALMMRPKLIICDEAVASLDVSIQAQILNLLFELKSALHLTYLFISHDLTIVRHFCDRVLVMYRGEIVEEGPAHTLFACPKHPYTQKLLSSALPISPLQK